MCMVTKFKYGRFTQYDLVALQQRMAKLRKIEFYCIVFGQRFHFHLIPGRDPAIIRKKNKSIKLWAKTTYQREKDKLVRRIKTL